MKKILLILMLVGTGFMGKAQTNPFPSTDSLERFINRWIRNSAVEAFQNLRLNTAMIGMLRFMQNSEIGSGVDTMYKLNDSTVRLITHNPDTFDVTLRFAGSGSTNTNVGSGFRWAVVGTNQIKSIVPGDGMLADSIANANSITIRRDTTGVNGTVTRTELLDSLNKITQVQKPVIVKEGLDDSVPDTLTVIYDTTTITIRTTGVNDSALTVNTTNISTVQRLNDTAAALRNYINNLEDSIIVYHKGDSGIRIGYTSGDSLYLKKLHVTGNAIISTKNDSTIVIDVPPVVAGSGTIKGALVATRVPYAFDSDSLEDESQLTYNKTTNVLAADNVMTTNTYASNAVGVGTTTPSGKFHINAFNGSAAVFQNTANTFAQMNFFSSQAGWPTITFGMLSTHAYLLTGTTHPLHLGVNSTARIVLTNTVGGWYNTSPVYRFDALENRTDVAGEMRVINAANTGSTANTTVANRNSYAGYFNSTTTISTGSNTLTNIGLYASASGGTHNYAAIFDQGRIGVNNTAPPYGMYINRSVGIEKDSLPTKSSTTGIYILGLDTTATVDSNRVVRFDPSVLSGGSSPFIYQFVSTQQITVSNTTTETTIYGTGQGSAGIDGTANVTTGTQVILKGAGTIDTDGAVAGEVTFAFKFPTSTVSIPVTGLATGLTGSTYTYEFKAIPLGTGTGQDYIWFMDIFVENNGTPIQIKVTGRETGVLTTTGTLTMNVTVDWNTADTDNTLVANFNTIEIVKK